MKPRIPAWSLMVLGAALGGSTLAQTYPTKPVRLITPSTAGSPVDIRARWLAERLSPVLGQPIVVDNRAGAGGSIGTVAAAKSAPDGYTLLLVHQGSIAINPHLNAKASYDPINDFAPVTRLVVSPMLLAVHAGFPAKSVADLIRLARERPGHLTFGSSGTGTPPHMAGELFKRMAKIDVVHVPYKGGAAALLDLIGGRISYTMDGVVIQLPEVRTGRIRALAVTGAKRLTSLPDVPTVAESGLSGFEYWSWMGISAPAATPKEIVTRLNQAIVGILGSAQAREWFAEQGGEPKGESPEDFAKFIRLEHARWGAIVRDAGIVVE